MSAAVDERDKTEYEIREEEKAKDAVDALSRYVNGMGHDPKVFAKRVMLEHRTLQQCMFNLFMHCIKEWAAQKWYDLRNECTVVQSRDIVEKCPMAFYVPFI